MSIDIFLQLAIPRSLAAGTQYPKIGGWEKETLKKPVTVPGSFTTT